MIAVSELAKAYGKRTALHGISFEVPAGEIYGFLGPNGAGKTTTLRILAALLEASSGTAFVAGADVRKEPGRVHRSLGYMPDFFGVYDQLTVAEYLDFYASCYRQPRARRRAVVESLLELVDLRDRRGQPVDTLSRGLKQRVCLARALVHDPAVLLLDEPASGLDPRARLEMREILKELQRMGKTIVISSHILPELTELCTYVGIIDGGRMVASGPLQEVIRGLGSGRRVRIGTLGDDEAAVAVLSGLDSVRVLDGAEGGVQVEYDGSQEVAAAILRKLMDAGVRVTAFSPETNGLEEAFLRATAGPAEAAG